MASSSVTEVAYLIVIGFLGMIALAFTILDFVLIDSDKQPLLNLYICIDYYK